MNSILVPIDLKETTVNALNYACQMAKHTGHQILALHVVKVEKERAEAEAALQKIIVEADRSHAVRIKRIVEVGKINSVINDVAEQHDVGLVIMGTYSAQGRHKLLGAKSLNVLARGDIPYLMVQKDTKYTPVHKVGLTIDTEKDCIQVVHSAAEMAQYFGGEVVLLAGDHTDRALKTKVHINCKLAMSVLKDVGIPSSVQFLDRKDFVHNMMTYCHKNDIQILAAAFYNDTINIFAEKFVQGLLENELNMPVLTMNSVSVGITNQYAFLSA